ncbi:hypothetical protein GCM10010149_88650 [Nonomuraea roseoviolacea subsp. roseoviolacea]|uniref:hypothetical protein n=1 Tax=Nonomuraea roseoviolacea TaxID=103837 RepID=UPI0031DE19A3
MSSTPVVVMVVDELLRDVSTGGPVPEGRRLYQALSGLYTVVLIADTPTDDVWLAVNGFDQHQAVVTRLAEDPDDVAIRRIRQVERLRAQGAALEYLVDPDPGVVAAVIRTGVPCLLAVNPPYARPEFHPHFTEEIRPWDQLVAEIDQTKALRAADTRHLDIE